FWRMELVMYVPVTDRLLIDYCVAWMRFLGYYVHNYNTFFSYNDTIFSQMPYYPNSELVDYFLADLDDFGPHDFSDLKDDLVVEDDKVLVKLVIPISKAERIHKRD